MPRTLTKKEQRLIDLAKSGGTDKDLVVLDAVAELEDKFDTVVADLKKTIPDLPTLLKNLKGVQGDQGEQGEQGPPGQDGKDGIDGQDGDDGAPGRDGKDGQDGTDGDDGAPGEDADPERIIEVVLSRFPQIVGIAAVARNALEALNGHDRLKASAIDGLDELINTAVKKSAPSSSYNYGVPGGAKGRVHTLDLTALCDGVTKSFPLPLNFGVIGVFSTQAPMIYRPGVDYTIAGRSITFTSQVGAPQTGQTLWLQYTK